MVVDIAPQQQLPEVFSTTRNHHCSHRRTSTTETMINGQRHMTEDLGKKADQILGRAPAVVDYGRQPSIDFANQHPHRLHIPDSKSRVLNQQVSPVPTSNTKDSHSGTVVKLLPLIFKLVEPLNYSKVPETISRHSKSTDPVINSRELVRLESDLNLSEDENEVADDEKQNEVQYSNSEMENDDELSRTNPQTLSLMDFLSPKHAPTSPGKRSASPPSIKRTKRKQDLIKSFSSSVHIPIDIKQPTLPITIPTYLFFDASIKTQVDEPVRSSKRDANSDTNEIVPVQKKSKTSHVYKSESNALLINIKEESNVVFANETSAFGNTATIAPMIVQPKKEKPTANVKPLLQSTSMENSSSGNTNANAVNPPDRLTTAGSHSSRVNHANLRKMSKKELNSLAREKKKQADGEKRTFEDVKQSMSLYLESVCYFIQCANDEPILDQRNSLLAATLNMLQHLVHNYQKMFYLPHNQSAESLNIIRQRFLLINYWLQSYIYHLQFNTNFSSIERCANQVSEYFSHSKSPAETNQNFICNFSKKMLDSYHSTSYWNKAERLIREEPLKKFVEQLSRQNQNRHLSRDYSTLDFLLYIFDAIDCLRTTSV